MKKTLLLLLIFTLSCSSPHKYLEKKRYDKAFSSALVQLKKGKSVEENKRVLHTSLDKIMKEQFEKATLLIEKDNIENGAKVLRIYERLRKKIEKTSPYLGLAYQTQMDSLDYRSDELMKDLFDFYYERAQESLTIASETGKKSEARNAYYDFQKAKKYGYENEVDLVTPLQEEALELGVVYYYVEASARFEVTEKWEIDRQFDDIESRGSIFQQITFEGTQGEVDCALDVVFKSLDFQIRERSDTEYFDKEIQDGYENVTDTSGNVTRVPLYRTVEAWVTTKTKIKTGSWTASVDVTSHTSNCDLSDSNFSAEASSEIEVTEWRGDDRAVPNRYKSAFQKEDFEDEDDMIHELIEDIYNQVVNYYF